MKRRCLVVGAGASGLMSAICAAKEGASVTVAEHMDKPGIKLALTGNGRCNYTNTDVAPDKYSCDNAFIRAVLEEFGYKDCIAFFESIGIEPEIRHYRFDTSGYVYPKGMNASDFRDKMYEEAVKLGVNFRFNVQDAEIISMIEASSHTACIREAAEQVEVSEAVRKYDSIIIAAGSNAYPKTGSDSSVYPALKSLGIKMKRFLPALCALYSKDNMLAGMKGKRVQAEAVLKIYDRDGAETFTEYVCSGEVQFNEHSISGIPVMQISRYASEALAAGRRTVLRVCGHDYEIHRTAGFDRSQVCSGGVSTEDIDPHTMRYGDSNIYFCGEITDVDGQCGGYNLHYAWASGYIAGRSAAGIGI